MRAIASAARPPRPPVLAAGRRGTRTAVRAAPPDDACALPPTPTLTALTAPRTLTLVRHGQSTWNAAGIIQGSSDVSRLTDKGRAQAAATRDALLGTPFDAMVHSPLTRAAETAAIIWEGLRVAHPRCGAAPVSASPALREIDLHSFEGLIKKEGGSSGPAAAAYATWQADPAAFWLDGTFPVRDLWARAAAAWGEVLLPEDAPGPSFSAAAPPPPHHHHHHSTLVVAHNAVNQALLCVALGLSPAAFRRLAQANGAASEVVVVPGRGGGGGTESTGGRGPPAVASVVRLNDRGPAAGPNLKVPKHGRALVVLVAVGEGGGAAAAAAAVAAALAAAPAGHRWALVSPPSAAAAAAALAAAAGLDAEVSTADDVSWPALAAAAAAGVGGDTATSLLALAPPAAVEAALAAAAGLAASPSRPVPAFQAPPWSVSCVEVGAGCRGGPAAEMRGTGWRGVV